MDRLVHGHLLAQSARRNTTGGGPSNPVLASTFHQFGLRRWGGIVANSVGSGTANAFSVVGMNFTIDSTSTQAPVIADPTGLSDPGYNQGHGVFGGYTTTASLNAVAGHRTPGEWVTRNHLPRMRILWRCGVNQAVSIDNCNIWIGLFSVLPVSAPDPGGHIAGFRWSTHLPSGAGDTTLRVLTRDGSTLRNISSGVAMTIGRVTLLEIDASDLSQIIYKVDENVVDIATVNLPDANTGLIWVFRVVNGNSGSGNATIRLGSVAFDAR